MLQTVVVTSIAAVLALLMGLAGAIEGKRGLGPLPRRTRKLLVGAIPTAVVVSVVNPAPISAKLVSLCAFEVAILVLYRGRPRQWLPLDYRTDSVEVTDDMRAADRRRTILLQRKTFILLIVELLAYFALR